MADGFLTPMEFIWTIVAVSVIIILFILYHMWLSHRPRKSLVIVKTRRAQSRAPARSIRKRPRKKS